MTRLARLQAAIVASITEPDGARLGAAERSAWIARSMTVSNLALPGGSIDWRWDGHAMRVTLRGPSRKIQLGASFPDDTGMSVTHDDRAADVTARVS